MTTALFKKTIMEAIPAAAKAFFSESAKNLANEKKKTEESSLTKVKTVKAAADMAGNSYNWNVIDFNAVNISEYVEMLAPVAAATLAGYIFLPVIAGATAFAAVGTGTAVTVYGFTNGAVLIGGAYSAGRKVICKRINSRYCRQNTDIYPKYISSECINADENSKDTYCEVDPDTKEDQLE